MLLIGIVSAPIREIDAVNVAEVDLEPERLPDCHAGGTTPEGYSASEETCPQCPEKFTCLPLSVEKGLSTDGDPEVTAVQEGRIALPVVQERMQTRARLISERKDVPLELMPQALVAAQPANEQTLFDDEAAPRMELVPPPNGPKTGTRAKRNWDSKPREISEQEMQVLLAPTNFKERGVRIGQPLVLEVGMQLVRRKRDREVVVLLRATGFEFAGKIFATLSAAAIASEHRSVSGNDFFSLVHPSAEIRAADGRVLARGGEAGVLPEQEPVAVAAD